MKIKVFSPVTGLRDVQADNLPREGSPDDSWLLWTTLVANRIRTSTFDFLRAVHPGNSGFLELRALQKGLPNAPSKFVSLPLDATGMWH